MSGWFSDNLTTGLALLAIAVHLSGLVSAVHAALRTRSTQGAVAWAILLVTFPYVVLPLYWVFGRGKFHGYVAARRSGDLALDHVADDLTVILERDHRAGLPSGEQQLRVYEQLADLPFTRGNAIELLQDGEAVFAAIFQAIEGAQDYVVVQTYLLRDDVLGRDLKARLQACARRGLRVHLLYDEIGSYGLPAAYRKELRAAGVQVSRFGTARGPVNRFQLNFRNHRKVVVVDGREAFVGGLNFGDEYLGRDSRLGAWRDTHLRVRGPVVQGIQLAFAADWFWAAQSLPQLAWQPQKAAEGDLAALPLASGPADQEEKCELFFLEAIRAARRRIWIASPYFVPDAPLMSALELARLRGVEVRLLLSEKVDHRVVHLAGYGHFPAAERIGLKLYHYRGGFLHQKVLLVDDDLAAIGTANLDNRSFRLNFELSVVVWDRHFAAEVSAMLEQDFAGSRQIEPGELDEKPPLFRLGVSLSRLLSPIL
jgi:cardiolipin synthase